MSMRWYFPSWSGDFRLVDDPNGGGDCCLLEIEKPTAHELDALDNFLTYAGKKRWVSAGLSLTAKPDSYRFKDDKTVKLAASVAVAGKALLRYIKPKATTITAVKFSGGGVEVASAAETTKFGALIDKAAAEAKQDASDEVKAASSTRPTPCCPQCIPGSIERASEVLLSFLNDEEHRQWAERRAIEVVGHLSGHRYLVCHRNSKLAQMFGRMCFDLTDMGVMHFHDWAVPPEEEVLAVKHILEHREPWLRNEATCFGRTFRQTRLTLGGRPSLSNGQPRVFDVQSGLWLDATPGEAWMVTSHDWRDVFKNPFGGFHDGVADAAFTASLGSAMMTMAGGS
jgi:hypothetical protein